MTADTDIEHDTDQKELAMTTTEVPLPPSAGATNAARPGSAARLVALLRSERIKVSTVRTFTILVAVGAVLGLLASWATAAFGAGEGLGGTDAVVMPTVLTAVLAAIAGVLLFTSEVQHGTLAGALGAHPSRWPVVGAKAVMAAGLGLLLGVVGVLSGLLGAMAAGVDVGDASDLATKVLWVLLYTVGSALLGLGIGMVVRHSAGAVSGILVWWLVVEGLIVQFAPAEVVRFVPFDTGFRTLGVESDLDAPGVVAGGLSNPAHASIFWGYVIAALVVGTVLVLRRDAD